MKLIDRHVLRCHLEPFLIGLSLATGVLFINVFKEYLDEFLAKGVSPFTIAEVLFLSLGHTLALSIPMAVLFATLMAFGQMAADNEVTALKAAGVHLYRVMLPAFVAAALVCVGMLLYNNFVLPESNHRLASLTSDIGRKRPTVNIEPGRFVTDFKGYQLLVGAKEEKSDQVHDVQVYIERTGQLPDLLVAPRGRLHFEDGGNTLYIDLYDGEWHSVPAVQRDEEGVYRITHFNEHTVVINDVGTALQRTDRKYRGDREMSIAMLREAVGEQEKQIDSVRRRLGDSCRRVMDLKLSLLDGEKRANYFATHRPFPAGRLTRDEERLRDTVRMEASSVQASVRQIRSYQVEIQKKYAIPAASLIFVLLGAPLAIRSGRSGSNMAIAFSMACFTVYYLFLTGGEKLADRQYISPYLAMWAANIVFGLLGLVLTWRASVESTTINWQRLDPRRRWKLRRRPPPQTAPAA
jgi:lipopolysaccharide export system permease protein